MPRGVKRDPAQVAESLRHLIGSPVAVLRIDGIGKTGLRWHLRSLNGPIATLEANDGTGRFATAHVLVLKNEPVKQAGAASRNPVVFFTSNPDEGAAQQAPSLLKGRAAEAAGAEVLAEDAAIDAAHAQEQAARVKRNR
jgi:hypothetical protein